MSALAFTNSIDFGNAAKCREFLLSKGVEIPDGMTDQLPAQAFHFYFTKEQIAEWDRAATEAELMEQAEGAWSEYKNSAPAKPDYDLKKLAEETDGALWVKARGKEGLFVKDPRLIEGVCACLASHKKRVIDAKFAELCPKKTKSKATGARRAKRDASEFELEITNTPHFAQGLLDYDYCLPCDTGAVMLKDGKIKKGVDGGKDKKTQSYKAIKKKTPFLTQGACKCGITWDRATGSKKLAELEIKGAFVMGCDKPREAGSDFCSKHQSKKPEDSVYVSKYKTGKYKGHTHAQVLWILNELDVEDGGQVLASGSNGWVEEECGENWIECLL